MKKLQSNWFRVLYSGKNPIRWNIRIPSDESVCARVLGCLFFLIYDKWISERTDPPSKLAQWRHAIHHWRQSQRMCFDVDVFVPFHWCSGVQFNWGKHLCRPVLPGSTRSACTGGHYLPIIKKYRDPHLLKMGSLPLAACRFVSPFFAFWTTLLTFHPPAVGLSVLGKWPVAPLEIRRISTVVAVLTPKSVVSQQSISPYRRPRPKLRSNQRGGKQFP
jgi:hypothetical protein